MDGARAASVALSRTVLTPQTLATYLPAFIATLTYALWHDAPFAALAAAPPLGLRQFALFAADVLRSTGLSFSVVLLALKYVHRLKTLRPDLKGADGSECRLLVCTLMLAMKYLMDNTYSNRTWEKISRIPLREINVTEIEFLVQLSFDLHVDEDDYFAWLGFVETAVVEFRCITADTQKRKLLAQQCLLQDQHPVHPAHLHHQQQQLMLHQMQIQQHQQQQQQKRDQHLKYHEPKPMRLVHTPFSMQQQQQHRMHSNPAAAIAPCYTNPAYPSPRPSPVDELPTPTASGHLHHTAIHL